MYYLFCLIVFELLLHLLNPARRVFGCAAERIPQIPKPLESPQALAFPNRAPHSTAKSCAECAMRIVSKRASARRAEEARPRSTFGRVEPMLTKKRHWQIYAHGLHGYVGASARVAPLRKHTCFPSGTFLVAQKPRRANRPATSASKASCRCCSNSTLFWFGLTTNS